MLTLEETFYALATKYTADTSLTRRYWQELSDSYSSKGRYYHNLSHLEHMLRLFREYYHMLMSPDAVLFALFYHDAVYDPKRKDNEAKSAALASEHMKALEVPVILIDKCIQHITATAGHEPAPDNDTNLFTDIDLSVLGTSRTCYEQYCQQIRREYAIYPDMLYKPGRRKVLQHFLGTQYIYKTQAFRERFEDQARSNMQTELQQF